MITDFGKFCRKLRIDQGELLRDMAEKINVKPAYLSAVEIGNRNIPPSWEQSIISAYNLNKVSQDELRNAIISTRKQVSFNLANLTTKDQDLVVSFARQFNDLSEEQKTSISKLLTKKS